MQLVILKSHNELIPFKCVLEDSDWDSIIKDISILQCVFTAIRDYLKSEEFENVRPGCGMYCTEIEHDGINFYAIVNDIKIIL